MKRLVRFCACAFALSALTAGAAASDESSDEAPASDGSAIEDPLASTRQTEPSEKFFRTLPLCRHLQGNAEVLYPGRMEWTAVEEGRFYPLGSIYRTVQPKTKMIVEFSKECYVSIEGVASFGTRRQGLGERSRSISLVSGKFDLNLPRNLPTNSFSVTAPGFTITSAIGKSTYSYEKTGDGDVAVIRCVTGSLKVKGMHFAIPAMQAADELKVRTSQDCLFTGLYGTSGDYELRLDQGMVQVRDIEKGTTHVEPKTLVWKLSPRTAVRIHRARPAIGERMSVTTMTFEPSGRLVNRCAFSEGRYELNTGEQGEIALKRIEEQSKKAAEQAELSAASAAVPAEEEPAAEKAEKAEKTDASDE